VDPPDRFQTLAQREFAMVRNAWSVAADPSPAGLQRIAASSTYKGLAHLKPPQDLVLYSNLIWELQPATIIEFGAFQGGSALWFADQLAALGGTGKVHSFELLEKCIHPTAQHARLHLRSLPHPWLVVDDAHENLYELVPYVAGLLHTGDYYIVEDVLLKPTAQMIREWVTLCEAHSLVVDTKYTDAFGYNVTCAPNAWFKSIRERG
jgi:cephalosporin hydroxylase